MEIKREYLQKYMHDIAVEQIADEYRHKGYDISKNEKIGKYAADLIARKENETIVFEVKSGKMTPQKKEAIVEIGDLVKKMNNYKFFVVIATPPQKKKLEVSNIEDLLTKYLEDKVPDELDKVSASARSYEVSQVAIDEINVQENGLVYVKGNGVVKIWTRYGLDSDEDHDAGSEDSFPFNFETTLIRSNDNKLEISEVSKLDIDTSDYWS